MRFLYLFLWFAFQYSFRLYFRKIKIINPSDYLFGRTIFVSNHQGSFMDPLIIASQRKPVVYFMTRSDVFNKFTRPILWAVHMLPIYRQRDGVDTKEKNAKIFEKTNQVLFRKRNILIFGEGFTDDRIQRRLHPIKKGPARIGFSALEYCQWEKEIFIQGLGVNYTDFNLRGSDVLIAAGTKIRLNDFREEFEENSAKAITEVTRLLEADMRTLVTDVHDPELADIHEDLMMLTRKGMHPTCFDRRLSIEARWKYSIKLADWMNSLGEDQLGSLKALGIKLNQYKTQLSALNVTEQERYLSKSNAWNVSWKFMRFVCLLPFFLLGAVHAGPSYLLIKRWVESKFKRPVFWGSTKKVTSIFAAFFINLPVLFILPLVLPWAVELNWTISISYFLCVGLFAQVFLLGLSDLASIKRYQKVKSLDLSGLNCSHQELMNEIHKVLPLL